MAPDDTLVNVNGPWLIKRQKWIDTIAGKFGEGILTQAPLTIDEGGHVAPFEAESLVKIINEAAVECYSAGVNIMALKHMSSVNPHVPICESKVRDLKKAVLARPSVCPFTIDVAVTWRPKQQPPWGQLSRVSPEATKYYVCGCRRCNTYIQCT